MKVNAPILASNADLRADTYYSDYETSIANMLEEARLIVVDLESRLEHIKRQRLAEEYNPVKFWREQRGIRQSELATAVGLSPAAICRIEHGQTGRGRYATRVKIAEVLRIPIEWLG